MKLTKRLLAILMVLLFALGFTAFSAAEENGGAPCECGWERACLIICDDPTCSPTNQAGEYHWVNMGFPIGWVRGCCPPVCERGCGYRLATCDFSCNDCTCTCFCAFPCHESCPSNCDGQHVVCDCATREYSCPECACYDLEAQLGLTVSALLVFADGVLQHYDHFMFDVIDQQLWFLELRSAWTGDWNATMMQEALADEKIALDNSMEDIFMQLAEDIYEEDGISGLFEARRQAVQLAHTHFISGAMEALDAIVIGAFRPSFVQFVQFQLANAEIWALFAEAGENTLDPAAFAIQYAAANAAQAAAFENVNVFVLAASGQWTALSTVYAELNAELLILLNRVPGPCPIDPDAPVCWCVEPPPPTPDPWWYIFPSWIRWIIYRMIDVWTFLAETWALIRMFF